VSLFRAAEQREGAAIWQGIPGRSPRRIGAVDVTKDKARSHSAVWASIRLRADLISSMPVHCYRKIGADGLEVEIGTPPVLIEPGSHGEGQPIGIDEWLYMTQSDLDSVGNAFGIITAIDGAGKPAQIQPVEAEQVTVAIRSGRLDHYKVGRSVYKPAEIWHERQYAVSGSPVGLSPIAYAAASVGGYLSAQQFALDWFANGATPSAILKNGKRTLDAREAGETKRRFMASVRNGEPFVTGMDWDYTMLGAKASESQFLEEMRYSLTDVARFFGVPADVIDAPQESGSITYANITQRNLQLLIMNIGPAVARRERALSRILPNPRRVKLDAEAILRMDPQTRQAVLASRVTARTLTVDEARAADNLPPLTPEQIAQTKNIFGTAPASAAPGAVSTAEGATA
jgi:HK97 family phage portal protein